MEVSSRKCDLSRLLEDSPESFYWLGFLMADGHFSKQNRVKVCLAEKDLKHLERLRTFLQIVTPIKEYEAQGRKYYEISAMDTDVLMLLRERFSISSTKTIVPCNLLELTEEQLFCLSIGFIDGDGSIRKVYKRPHAQLTVKCHSSWLENLRLLYPDASTKLDASGYAKASITDSETLRQLKLRAMSFSLPLMERKWNNIDTGFVSREQRTKENIPVIVDMLENGFTQAEICAKLGYKKSALSNLLKRKGLR